MLSSLLEKIKNKNLIKEEKFFYLFAVILFFLQISMFIKLFTIHCVKPDLLLVLLVFFSLNFSFTKSLKFSIFIGLLKDLVNPSYILLDVFLYSIIMSFIFILKKFILFENLFLRMFLIILVSALYIFLKASFFYLKDHINLINPDYIYFLFLNILIFLIFNLFVENYKERKSF